MKVRAEYTRHNLDIVCRQHSPVFVRHDYDIKRSSTAICYGLQIHKQTRDPRCYAIRINPERYLIVELPLTYKCIICLRHSIRVVYLIYKQ